MIKTILLTITLLLPLSANAEAFTLFGGESNLSIAAGTDIHKALGYDYGEVRYRETLYEFESDFWDEFGFSLYAGTMMTLGGDLYVTHGNWMYGWGIEGAKSNEDVVDSIGGYELLVEYEMTEHWAISLKHRSNCRQICRNLDFMPKGSQDKSNGGFNWLMLRYTF